MASGLDIVLTQPVLQAGLADPEIRSDLPQRNSRLTTRGNRDNVLPELSGIGIGHDDILPAVPPGTTAQMSPNPASRPDDAAQR